MKKFLAFIKKQTAFLAAALVGSVVGGATTAVVIAAIPNSQSGQINACYRNPGGPFNPTGSLRVIDAEAGQNCNALETALNWDQEGVKAYGHVKADGLLDSTRSKNIASFSSIQTASYTVYCLDLSVVVRNVSLSPAGFTDHAASIDSEEWVSISGDLCPSGTEAIAAVDPGIPFYINFQ